MRPIILLGALLGATAAHSESMTYIRTEPETVQAVKMPLILLNQLYAAAVKRCDETKDCDARDKLFWVAKINKCSALSIIITCPNI
jgi:hypothetical protein